MGSLSQEEVVEVGRADCGEESALTKLQDSITSLSERISTLKSIRVQLTPWKLCIGVKYYIVHSCIHQNDSLQVAVPSGMRTRIGRAQRTDTSALLLLLQRLF